MPSFQIGLSPTKRAAGRFVYAVRRALQKALAEEQQKRGLTQTEIAKLIGVHRSVINRELRGAKDITLGRVAELAHALGRKAVISFPEAAAATQGSNISIPPMQPKMIITNFTEVDHDNGPTVKFAARAA